jgi:hypothetical protein
MGESVAPGASHRKVHVAAAMKRVQPAGGRAPQAHPQLLFLLLLLLGLGCLVAHLARPSGAPPPRPTAARGSAGPAHAALVLRGGGGATDSGAETTEKALGGVSEHARNETRRLDAALREAVREYNTSLAADLVRPRVDAVCGRARVQTAPPSLASLGAA